MKQKLPLQTTKVIALFPSFLRFITEFSFTPFQSRNIKIFLVSALSVFLLTLIFLQGVVMWHTVQQREFLVQERVQLQKEIAYWQQVSEKYHGYRDVYYRIATLQYQLGNVSETQIYVKKTLELDPNFAAGRVLGTKVGL